MRTETNAKASTTVGVVFAVVRVAVFAGLALLIGGAVFLVLIARGTSAGSRTRVLIWAGWILLTASTVAAVMLQGPYAAGSGIGDAIKWSVVATSWTPTTGTSPRSACCCSFPRSCCCCSSAGSTVSAACPCGGSARAPSSRSGLAATPGYAGHAATGTFTIFAVPLDTIHVLAMSVWLGGLVVLVVAALGGGFSGGLRRGLTVFSRVAFWCVVVLVLTGLFASWRQVGFSIRGYTSTSYGNILLVKLAVVAALLGVAAVSRSIVRKRRSAPLDAPDSAIAAIDERTVVGLRRSVAGEVVLGLAVLAVTAMLVNAQPARSALVPKLFSQTVTAGSGESAMLITVTVDPARVGENTVHIYTETTKGENLTIRDISAKLVSADRSTSVPAELKRGGPNHFLNETVAVPVAGNYQMLVQVLQVKDGRLIPTAGVVTVPIR